MDKRNCLSLIALLAFGLLASGSKQRHHYRTARSYSGSTTSESTPAPKEMAQTGTAARYVDPHGHFNIIPPPGWRIQEYPDEPRGKVAFFGPDGVDLRILVNAVEFTDVSSLVEFCRGVEKKLGVSTNIERVTWQGFPAVQRSFETGGRKFRYVDFLVGQADHNLGYSAPTGAFDENFAAAAASMDTYEPVKVKLSSRDVVKHTVAKKKRLAQLMIEGHNYELAREFVKEGLALAPKDAGLLKVQKRIATEASDGQ
jgi:hypothetical protein